MSDTLNKLTERRYVMIAVCMSLIDNTEHLVEFNSIVEKYERKLFGYALSILHNSSLAEEAVWDTFGSIARSFDKVRNGTIKNIDAYLIITLKNFCFQIHKSEKKNSSQLSFEDISEFEMPSFDEFSKYEVKMLSDALCTLEDQYKSVIVYMLYYDYTAEDTAHIMGISRSTVYKYLNDAKIILRKKLGDNYG